jgi:hypothetical protein
MKLLPLLKYRLGCYFECCIYIILVIAMENGQLHHPFPILFLNVTKPLD